MTTPATPLALTFILLTVALDAIGIGLIFPVMPDLMMEVTGKSLSEAAIWGGLITASFAVMQFLFGPIVGNLSDRYGRRPVLLASMTVMALVRIRSRIRPPHRREGLFHQRQLLHGLRVAQGRGLPDLFHDWVRDDQQRALARRAGVVGDIVVQVHGHGP